MSESIEALRRANPRSTRDFEESVDVIGRAVRAQLVASPAAQPGSSSRRRLVRLSVVCGGLAAVAAAVYAGFVSTGAGPVVENAAAAVKHAATVSAASAKQSGTVDVRITHDGRLWAGEVIRWNGNDVSLDNTDPRRARSGYPLLVVDGIMYGHDPAHEGWVEVGPVTSIDPGSGTTPTEQLDAIRQDVGGTTLRRIVGAMTANGLTTRDQSDGSTVYSGTVVAGQIARETGFKEGEAIRVFPFGYVAHGAAADPASLLDTSVTVGTQGVIRNIAMTWGTWTYTVAYSGLASTAPIVAPTHAASLLKERMRAVHGR